MKTPCLQRAHTTEDKVPSILPVAEEKSDNKNIFINSPIQCKNSPFDSRNIDRKKYPNEQAFPPISNEQSEAYSEFSEEKSEEIYKNQKRNEIINYISEPYYNTVDQNRFQKKNIKRQKNKDEINQKRKESPENGKMVKKHKKRPVRVEITKTEGPSNNLRYKDITKFSKSLNPNNNNKDECIFYCQIPYGEEERNLDNVSFSNKNIDTNNYQKNKKKKSRDKIDPKIMKQFKLISEIENNKLIQKLEKEKDKLTKENKKLNKNYSNFEKERQKFENEKKLFFESRNRVINDSRKNEERLIQLENELQNKFMQKKNEIEQMRNQLKQEQLNLDKERNNMRDNYQIRLSKLEEDYKIKEETQNYNNNLNIDKTRKEQELLRKKEQEINQLKKAFMDRENNLKMRENDLINKENELLEKESELNNKYQSIIEKEKDLRGEKEKFLNNNEENQKDLFLKTQQLKDREEQLASRENILLDKENEIKNKENMISSYENELKKKENLLNKTQNQLFNQQNEINDKVKQINFLDQEIKDKRNQIIELNNAYNEIKSKMSSPKSQKNNLEDSKGSQKIKAEIHNLDSLNRPSITGVKKIDKKFNPNNEMINDSNNMNMENLPINKVVTFGNKNSLTSNLTNNNNDIRDNDSYPENNLNDIKDNDAFPENHLHDIQDNDEYPENHGEDDFVYGNNQNNNNEYNNNEYNNNDNNNNAEMNENEYEEMAEDFDQYINNQSQNKSEKMDDVNNNNNIPIDEEGPNKDANENTPPYNFYLEKNNDLMNKDSLKDSVPNKDDNNNMINNNNENEIINNNNGENKLKESESGEIDLNNFNKENLDIEGSQHQYNQNNENKENIENNENIINNENKINDHEEEINDIIEELNIEDYNPSLGLIAMDYPKFLNSLIQCFAHIPDITDKVINLHLDLNFKNGLNKLKLTNKYRNLLINLFFPEKVYNMEHKPFNPTLFRNVINELNPLFKTHENIELKEFINYFILKLHDELNTKKDAKSQYHEKNINEMEIKNENEVLVDFLKSFTEKNISIISKTLYGITKFTLYCNQCQNSFFNFQCYSHLYFNLDHVMDYKINRYHREDINLDLYDCLDYYQKTEMLRGDNGIFCPQCKIQTESTSLKNIYSTKNIIIFILDRNIGNNFNQTYINFDENLNLRDYVEYKKEGEKNKEKFFLGGIINYYMGDDELNGTYKAFIKMGKKNDWYCYEDENVYSVPIDDIKNNGYPVALFYHKLIKKLN